MSGRSRRAAMATIVTFVMLWPLAHLALVARFGTDPWEFFGWAMYSLPAARVQVRVEVERSGRTEAWRVMGAPRQRLRDYARRRTALGRLASPATLAASIFAEDPEIDALRIVLREIRLDRASSRLVTNDQRIEFDRP